MRYVKCFIICCEHSVLLGTSVCARALCSSAIVTTAVVYHCNEYCDVHVLQYPKFTASCCSCMGVSCYTLVALSLHTSVSTDSLL
jgi:hypothetical protein